MPEHIRSLIVILILSTPIFILGKGPIVALGMKSEDFDNRRKLWFSVTLIAFLSHNFWIFIILSGFTIHWFLKKEENKFSMYLFILLALPMIEGRLYSPVVIEYFLDFHYGRLLSVVILLPIWHSIRKDTETYKSFGKLATDRILIIFLILNLILSFRTNYYTITHMIRVNVLYAFLDVFLPYYIASRVLNSIDKLKDAMLSFIIAVIIMSMTAIFEISRHWLLYSALDEALGQIWDATKYLGRGSFLRAIATAGQAIATGYTIAVGFGTFLAFKRPKTSGLMWSIGLAATIGGLIAALSRGPWIGALFMLILFILTSQNNILIVLLSSIFIGAALIMVSTLPIFEQMLQYLPFVGTVDSENVAFRQYLLETGLEIFMQNPILGSPNANLEQFTTGEGIIDIVNSYLTIAFDTGIVGLSLFASFFLTSIVSVYRSMKKVNNAEIVRIGRSIFATLCGIMLIIFTVSSITIIPYLYWIFGGIGTAYFQITTNQNSAVIESAQI